jgi:large subunit ribosomal protein L22
MKAITYQKYLNVSPSKILRFSREIKKGDSVNLAIAKLSFLPNKSAKLLAHAIKNAKANLIFKATEKNLDFDENKFVIEKILVQKAPTLKRLRPRGRGRADIINKRKSHIYVEINDGNVEE